MRLFACAVSEGRAGKVVDEMLEVAAEAVKVILTEGPAAAMNRFNRKGETEKD
jgi:hypothetical protein